MSQDVHARVLARLAELRATAEAAVDAYDAAWHVQTGHEGWEVRVNVRPDLVVAVTVEEAATHIAAWSPAVVLRWLAWADDVAEQHGQDTIGGAPLRVGEECRCGYSWPCRDLAGLAAALGLEGVS